MTQQALARERGEQLQETSTAPQVRVELGDRLEDVMAIAHLERVREGRACDEATTSVLELAPEVVVASPESRGITDVPSGRGNEATRILAWPRSSTMRARSTPKERAHGASAGRDLLSSNFCGLPMIARAKPRIARRQREANGQEGLELWHETSRSATTWLARRCKTFFTYTFVRHAAHALGDLERLRGLQLQEVEEQAGDLVAELLGIYRLQRRREDAVLPAPAVVDVVLRFAGADGSKLAQQPGWPMDKGRPFRASAPVGAVLEGHALYVEGFLDPAHGRDQPEDAVGGVLDGPCDPLAFSMWIQSHMSK